ncbi:Retinal guanylyl cyclase 2 [Hypsibius exemplaris]|uniref:Guanylate cyclase n=1 Tax=Hypsibius exemplaris TaxID=2072580 RepID=A0A1W0X833_HYPEX|nr:Retinal guanylyl cyclase 2 [Hypsibius exemplaris]
MTPLSSLSIHKVIVGMTSSRGLPFPRILTLPHVAAVYSDLDLTYQAVGSGDGIKKFVQGLYDYAGSDEDLDEADYANNTDFQLFPSFAGPIAIAYNIPEIFPNSQVPGSGGNATGNLNLTRENLVGIFNGSIRYWNDSQLVANNSDLQFVQEPIIVVVRNDASGTTSIITRALASFSANWPIPFQIFSDGCTKAGLPRKWNLALNLHCAAQTRGLSSYLLNTKYSIGYVGSSEARDALLPDARLLNQDNNWVRPTVETTQAAMENVSTALGSRLTGSLVNAPGPRSYPIAGYTYIIIRKNTMQNCTTAMELYRMFSFLLENPLAQSIVIDQINAPLSVVVLRQVKQRALAEMTCGGVAVSDLVTTNMAIEDGSIDAWKLPVMVVGALLGAALLMMAVFYLYVQYTHNRSALRHTFIVALNVVDGATKSMGSVATMNSNNSSKTQMIDTMDWATSAGAVVVKIKGGEHYLLRKMCFHLTPDMMQWSTKVAIVRLKEKLNHANLMKLVGISFHDGKWKLVTSCPNKGRLQDILQAGKYHLDSVFRYSILTDAAEGMIYLHKNGIVHGQLTSNSCYIDARWNVLIGDWEQFALHKAQRVQFVAFETEYSAIPGAPEKDVSEYAQYLRCLYWTAPEAILRDHKDIFIVTNPDKSADVYSYGVIAFEVFTDLMPYENAHDHDAISRPYHILAAVKMDHLRPTIPPDTVLNSVHATNLMQATWKKEPNQRPNFPEILKMIRIANPKSRSIIDSMMQAVEAYAQGLEDKVAERTKELEKLTHNMESLLHSMLPSSIADKLAKGLAVEPEFYESSTLFFSDIVGFTSLAAVSAPIDIVTLLNDLYSAFDGVIQRFDVYKVETIGDSYMCISGLPNRNGSEHANQIASMSLDMLFTVTTIPIKHIPEKKLQIRIGAHTGAVVAGVVGITMPRYCLFGDTVNTASRMESSSLPMRIQISEATEALLETLQVYKIVARGEFNIKGKGMMKTFWLVGKQGYTNPLPILDPADDERLASLLDKNQVK